MKRSAEQTSFSGKLNLDERNILGISMILLLGINFLLGYIVHHHYSQSLLQFHSLGFWLFILNFSLITGIVIWNKHELGWDWSDLGLGRPKNWWRPLLVAVLTYGAVTLFGNYITPHILKLGERPNISHLMAIKGNLPLLIFALTIVWITAAFLEELIFRAYLINGLERLFGKSWVSTWSAVLLSSVIFGLIHAYQGLTGILITGSLGFIFGVAFVLNGRRIWPLILVHGLIDTLSFISIYNMS